jgi:hypothetical protein
VLERRLPDDAGGAYDEYCIQETLSSFWKICLSKPPPGGAQRYVFRFAADALYQSLSGRRIVSRSFDSSAAFGRAWTTPHATAIEIEEFDRFLSFACARHQSNGRDRFILAPTLIELRSHCRCARLTLTESIPLRLAQIIDLGPAVDDSRA